MNRGFRAAGAVVSLVLAVWLLASLAGASNMAFKLNKSLVGAGTNGSKSGTQDVALPFVIQFGLTVPQTASDLRNSIINAGGLDVRVARVDPQSDALIAYAGLSTMNNFNLTPGEGYRIKLSNDVEPFYIRGAHDPGYVVPLIGFKDDPMGDPISRSGTSLYSYPYHSTAELASELQREMLTQGDPRIGMTQLSVSRFNPQTDGLAVYAGISFDNDFRLVPGEAYVIKTPLSIAYVPSHY